MIGLTRHAREYYRDARLVLLPSGKLLDGDKADTGSDLYRLMNGKGIEDERFNTRLASLLEESDPATTLEMLKDWERMLAITPNPSDTFNQRRQEVLNKLAGYRTPQGGQALQAVAARFGVTLTPLVNTAKSWLFGGGGTNGRLGSRFEKRLYGLRFNHLFSFVISGHTGDPAPLLVELEKAKLAHLTLESAWQYHLSALGGGTTQVTSTDGFRLGFDTLDTTTDHALTGKPLARFITP